MSVLHALTDVIHCLYFMFVSLGLGAGLCYTLSLTSLTVCILCRVSLGLGAGLFYTPGDRPVLHALTDVTHCLYFLSVSLGLGTGLFYTPSLTSFTVFHICFPRARGRSVLHTLRDGHQQLLPQVPCGGQRRDTGIAWHWNRRSALSAALAHRRLRLAIRHVPLWLLHGSGWNRYVTVSVLGTVMSLCQSWEPLCHCVGPGWS